MQDVNPLVAKQSYGAYIIATGASIGFDTGGVGTPNDGVPICILVTGVVGNPNVVFGVQTSPDNVNWNACVTDDQGPINAPAARFFKFFTNSRWYRIVWWFQALEPSLNSGNSSSLSGQSFNVSLSGMSSSSGGSLPNGVVFEATIVPSLKG